MNPDPVVFKVLMEFLVQRENLAKMEISDLSDLVVQSESLVPQDNLVLMDFLATLLRVTEEKMDILDTLENPELLD